MASILASNALVSVTELLRYMDQCLEPSASAPCTTTIEQNQLEQAINAASDWVERKANRTFNSTAYAAWHDGSGDSALIMPQYPITAVARVSIGEVDALTVRNDASDATQAYASVSTTGVTLVIANGASAGTDTVTFAVSTTITTVVAAINALGKGWTATAQSGLGNFQSSILRPVGGLYCYAAPTWLTIPDQPESSLRITFDDGMILAGSMGSFYGAGGIFPRGVENVYVEYTAGYTTIPASLKQIVLEMSANIFNEGSRDLSLKSEKLGDYSYTQGSITEFGHKHMVALGPFIGGTY